ncbi:hypothetical protein KV112_21850 [Mycolicibacter sp. MYC123]|uniref:Mammalian cell entry protein n=1 Tax=[Mycobacterium] zoologicum TaxID=2872311 RepID=A0ABU5YQI9_9MYCO|nr:MULTISPECIES: hypothetical protein [unclassified Mycolicibacter]MEB3052340.1 hypothetical protein [Mycolicibacter sp. MYC123]MEB3062220.1 hypothetical protein [Mycolicibacter sp. MYC101]
MRFNAPPGWEVPTPDWVPDAGWAPDPSWPPAPPSWNFFVDDEDAGVLGAPVAPGAGPAPRGAMVIVAAVAAVLVVALLGIFLVRLAVSKSDDRASAGAESAGPGWTIEPTGPNYTATPGGPAHNAAAASAITFEGMRDFVYRHYSDLPANPRATWDRLDSQFTARLSWSDYAGFWATIQSVSVTSVQPDGPDSVIARLALVPYRGNTSSEQRRIKFVSTGGVLQIHESDLLG